MDVQRFDRKQARAVGDAAAEMLSELADALGLELTCKPLIYDSVTLAVKFDFAVRDDGTGKNAAQRKWEMHAPAYGLRAEWFGKEYMSINRRMRIVGWNPRARCYPVQVMSVASGRRYKVNIYTIVSAARTGRLLDPR